MEVPDRGYTPAVIFAVRQAHRMADLGAYDLGWVEARMADMGQVAASYPGDENVPVDYSKAMSYDPKGMAFPKLAIRVVLASAQEAGVEVSPQVYEDVKRMAVGPEATDTYLDDIGRKDDPERRRRHGVVIGAVEDIVENLQPISDSSEALRSEAPVIHGGLRYFGNALHTMPDRSRHAIGEHAISMLETSLEKSRAEDLATYAKLAYQEGAHYGRVWAETVWARQPEELRAQSEEYGSRISDTLGRLLVASAGIDLRRDYEYGEIAFHPRPLLASRLYLVGKGCGSLPKVAGLLVRLARVRNSADRGPG